MLDVAKFGLKHNVFFCIFLHVGIPVSAEKNKRHTIIANENGAEALVQLSCMRKEDDRGEADNSNGSIEY